MHLVGHPALLFVFTFVHKVSKCIKELLEALLRIFKDEGVYVGEEKAWDEGCCVHLGVSFREAKSPVSVFAQCCSNPALSVAQWGEVERVNYRKPKHTTMSGLVVWWSVVKSSD